jgi:hypothetical protein
MQLVYLIKEFIDVIEQNCIILLILTSIIITDGFYYQSHYIALILIITSLFCFVHLN